MRSRKKLLKKSRLYAILDPRVARGPLSIIARKISGAGVDIIQLRDKNADKTGILAQALRINAITRRSNTLFILNDFSDLAKTALCDGVHLGQCDGLIENARQILGNDRIIGVSCHCLEQAVAAQKQGADYVGLGPIFSSTTKREDAAIGMRVIAQVRSILRIPFFVIGGITQSNLGMVCALGAKRIAVCSAILKEKNEARAAESFLKRLRGLS